MIRIKWDDGGRLRWRNLEYVKGWTHPKGRNKSRRRKKGARTRRGGRVRRGRGGRVYRLEQRGNRKV